MPPWRPESSISRSRSTIPHHPSGNRDSHNPLATGEALPRSQNWTERPCSSIRWTASHGRHMLSNDGAAFTRAGSPTSRAIHEDCDLSRWVDCTVSAATAVGSHPPDAFTKRDCVDFWYRYGVMRKGVPPKTWDLGGSPRDPEVQTQRERQSVTLLLLVIVRRFSGRTLSAWPTAVARRARGRL
jgi:hypothetical protein